MFGSIKLQYTRCKNEKKKCRNQYIEN